MRGTSRSSFLQSSSSSPEARRRRILQHRKPRHQEDRRGGRPLLHISPMTQLTGLGEHDPPMMGEIRGLRVPATSQGFGRPGAWIGVDRDAEAMKGWKDGERDDEWGEIVRWMA